jgi:CheY-like chemotaxis protein
VVDAALRATGKAADLVRQMLAFGRAQPLQPSAVAIRDFLLQSQELASKALGERVLLTASVAPDAPPVFVDPSQLELALLNLVFNARDAMPDGGTVTILARPAAAQETASLGEGRFACIEVVDDGPGMDEQTRARAFDPYFTTKPVGKGTGLGLPQVLAFARQSGGDARLDSVLGAGTRVTLYLPVALETAPREGTSEASGPPSPARGARLRILMVEDDVLVASVVGPALEDDGHRVAVVDTADRAFAMLRDGGDFDVLFTDVVMPGKMSGMDLVAWCREHRPSLAAVVATGYTAQQSVAGVQVLRKPYSMEALTQALARAVGAGAPASA